jgi:hypothetical protein
MRIAVVSLSFAVLLLNAPYGARAEDAVPGFDIAANCKAEVVVTGGFGETVDYCTRAEENSKQQLAKQWAQFAKADKAQCILETSSDGTPSYVELETCLELASDNGARLEAGKK